MSIKHILAPFQTENESAWLAIHVAENAHKTGDKIVLWSTQPPTQHFLKEYGVNLIRPYQGQLPTTGELIVVGTESGVGVWYETASFDKVDLIYHQFSPARFNLTMQKLTFAGNKKISLQYTFLLLKEKTGLPGDVIELPWNARIVFKQPIAKNPPSVFTIGRVGEDSINKHHYDDIYLYKELASLGCNIKLAGSTCLKPWLNNIDNIELLPAIGTTQLADFIFGLNCAYFNVAPTIIDGPSIAMMGATYADIPIIAYTGSGYSEHVGNYAHGLLFNSVSEAYEIFLGIINKQNKS